MKLAFGLAIGLAVGSLASAHAQAVRWTSQDGVIFLTVPAIWKHESAPPEFVGDVPDTMSLLMHTVVRKPESLEADVLCEISRISIDPSLQAAMKPLSASRLVELSLQLLAQEEDSSNGLLDHEVIASDKTIGGVPVLDYTTRATGSAAVSFLGPNTRVRTVVPGAARSHAFVIRCSAGKTRSAVESIETFMNSLEINKR